MEKSKNETFEFNAFQFLKDAVERGDITQEKMNIVVNATKNKSVLIEFAVHSEYPVTDAVTLAFANGYESAVGSEFLRNCMKPKWQRNNRKTIAGGQCIKSYRLLAEQGHRQRR